MSVHFKEHKNERTVRELLHFWEAMERGTRGNDTKSEACFWQRHLNLRKLERLHWPFYPLQTPKQNPSKISGQAKLLLAIPSL